MSSTGPSVLVSAGRKTHRHLVLETIPHAFGFRPGIDLDKLNQLADELEAAAHIAKDRHNSNCIGSSCAPKQPEVDKTQMEHIIMSSVTMVIRR